MDTFGNKEWLAANFTKSQITDSRVTYALQYPGQQLLSPVAVLEKAAELATGVHHKYATQMEQYKRAIGALGTRLPGLIHTNMEPDAVKGLLENLATDIAKVPVPIPNNTQGPEFFGTWRAVITEDRVEDGRLKNLPSQQTMPPITFETVYKAAHLIVKQLDIVIAAPTQIPWAGVDMFSAGPWDKLPDADKSKLDQLLGMDGRPGDYHHFVWVHYYEWGMLLQAVAQWLYLTCQPNKD